MPDSGPLFVVAAALADGTEVDWETAAHSITAEQDLRLLAELRFIAGILRTSPVDSSSGMAPAIPGTSPGDLWGPLKIIEVVGRGSFGDVYRAWDSRLDREVALKILRRRERDDDARVSTVVEEGRLLARVRHPNVVTVYGAERVAGQVGVWMEFIHGKTLEEELREQGPFEIGRVIDIGFELAGALATVHRAGLIHRDIKTQNVMRDGDGRLVLTDFGAGCDLREGIEDDNRELAGTPLCAAPEVLAGQPPTQRSDIYSLGVLLYRLVSDAYPVSGRTLKEVRDAHARGVRTPVAAARPDLPSALVRIVERALDPDPHNRYETPDTLRSELASLLVPAVDERRTIANGARPQSTDGGKAGAFARSPSWHRWWFVTAPVVVLAIVLVWIADRSGTIGPTRGESSAAFNSEIELVQVVALAEQGRLEDAYERALGGRSAAPGSPDAASGVAYVLTYAGFLDDAERAIDDVFAANPDYIKHNGWWTPTALLYQRNFPRFLQAIGHTDTSASRVYRAVVEMERGEPAKAIPHVFGVDAGGADVFNALAIALHDSLTDRKEAAVGMIRSIGQQRRAARDTDGEITFKQAQILSVAGDTPFALALLDEAVVQGFVCVACFESSVLLEPVRALPGYRRVKESALARQLAFGRRFGLPNRPSTR